MWSGNGLQGLNCLKRWVGTLVDEARYEEIGRFGADFLRAKARLIARRVEHGWFRDLHGDLRSEHICFAADGIQVFDCLEFSAPMRRKDVAAEVAFATMDLESRGAGRLVQDFLNGYRELAPLEGPPELLAFYRCHAAIMRAAVTAVVPGAARSDAARSVLYAR